MAKSELKTKLTAASPTAFIDGVTDEGRRKDCKAVLKLMSKVTGAKARMWGTSIVGFGTYHYKYASGQEGDWPLVGFSPRKQNLTLYIMAGFTRYEALMARLGPVKTGKSCLYIKNLADIDMKVLETLIAESVKHMKKQYPSTPGD